MTALGARALNRALLARQLLLERHDLPAVAAIEHLVGMQAQAPLAPYVGLWTRLRGFRAEELAEAMRQRRVVRIALLRSTIFLVSARDCVRLRPAVQPVIERGYRGGWGKRIGGLELDQVAAAGRALVEAEPLGWGELGAALAERWPEYDAEALAQLVRTRVPLVQVTPRGVWGMGGAARHTSAEAWLGMPMAAEADVEGMILRYLAAYGPAGVRDAQTWCGLTRLGELFDRLRPRLTVFRDERGGELFDLPDAPRPAADVPAPVRFLPEYDNILLSHHDRTRIVPEACQARFRTANGLIRGSVLLDGFVSAIWKIERVRDDATLVVEGLRPLTAPERAAVEDEAAGLLDFAAGDAAGRGVRFA